MENDSNNTHLKFKWLFLKVSLSSNIFGYLSFCYLLWQKRETLLYFQNNILYQIIALQFYFDSNQSSQTIILINIIVYS